ncbi:MAG: HypC/HybG/HupF family hydrogenase formation chaperone [Thermoanaerobacteraceae bacterium]|nr:HypC/HybG/HupF family hydrogenase formation chaperone [Thermoanaerobacteraceae bacterium]
MCLAVPLKVRKKEGDMAEVGLKGLRQQVSVALTPEVKEGDWVLVHAGFAIQRLEENDALETLSLLEELNEAGN